MPDDTTEAREFLRGFVGAGPTIESRYETWFRIVPCMLAYAAAVRRETREECAALEKAARRYFDGYCQDEADDRESCIEDEQHAAAIALRDALASYRAGAASTKGSG